MTHYRFEILGETDITGDEDAAIAYEREKLRIARDAVARLTVGVGGDRITDAIFVGDRLGVVDLLAPATPVGLRVRS